MIRNVLRLARDAKGASALEFALVAPAFILVLLGIAHLGIISFATAGLNNAIAQGARRATLYPRPSEQAIEAEIEAARWGLDPEKLEVSLDYVDTKHAAYKAEVGEYAALELSYPVSFKFVFFDGPSLTLTQSRRVYLQPLPPK